MKYELQGLTPFNDVYYVNCFYLSIFTAIKYLGGSIFSFIANDYFTYELEETSNGLSLNIIKQSGVSPYSICEYNCINIEERFDYCEDIITFIKDSILNNNVIVLPIDGFFYKHPFHDLYYLKEHHYNAILIYGFDSETEVFKTTETNAAQWNTINCYYKHQISFKDLITAHEGFFKYLKFNPPRQAIIRLSKNNTKKMIDYNPVFYRNTMVNNLKAHKNVIINSLHNISVIIKSIEVFDIDDNTSFNNLIASVSNLYAIRSILGPCGNCIQLLNEIIDMWSIIRAIIYKSQFRQIKYNRTDICSRLSQLYTLENMLYEKLFLQLDTII